MADNSIIEEGEYQPYDPLAVPAARDGFWKAKGLYIRWLNKNPRQLRLKLMRGFGFPGYQLFGGGGKESTMKLIEELGLKSSSYDSTLDAIVDGDLILGYVTIEEREKRLRQRAKKIADMSSSSIDNAMGRIDQTGLGRPVKYDGDEYEDRKKHARRDAGSRVGYRAAG